MPMASDSAGTRTAPARGVRNLFTNASMRPGVSADQSARAAPGRSSRAARAMIPMRAMTAEEYYTAVQEQYGSRPVQAHQNAARTDL